MDISEEAKRKILKQYLGKFATKISAEEWASYKAANPKLVTIYKLASPEALKIFGACALLAHGKQSYRMYYSYELVDAFLGNKPLGQEEGDGTFYDSATPLLILYHSRNTMENRQLENMLCHCIERRALEGKVTVVLTEVSLPKVDALFVSRGWQKNTGFKVVATERVL